MKKNRYSWQVVEKKNKRREKAIIKCYALQVKVKRERNNYLLSFTIVISNGTIVWKVVWVESYLRLNLSSRRNQCLGYLRVIKCKHWMCRKIDTAVSFLVIALLEHSCLYCIIPILIWAFNLLSWVGTV